jgi:hypothetical protein
MAFTEKVVTTNETLRTEVTQSNARAEKSDAENAILKQANAKWEQAYAKLEQANVVNEDILMKVNEQLIKQRLAVMAPRRTKKMISTISGNLASISTRVKDRTAKRAIEEFTRNSLNQGDPVKIFEGYNQMISKVDKRTRAEIEDKVLKPLMGD